MTQTVDMNSLSREELEVWVASLTAENGKLKAKAAAHTVAGMSLRVGEKGGLSVYGVGRFPVTLYASQWRKLLAIKEDIELFMLENASSLKEKEAK